MENRKLKEKILSQYKEELLESIKIIKKTKKNIEFEINGISGVYNIIMKTAPQWFKEFEKRNNKRFDKIEDDLKDLKTIVKKNHPEDFK